MRALLLLAGLSVVAGLDACRNDVRVKPIKAPDVQTRLKHQAKFWKTAWKMVETASSVSDEELHSCESCGPTTVDASVKELEHEDGTIATSTKLGSMFSFVPGMSTLLAKKAWKKATRPKRAELKKVIFIESPDSSDMKKQQLKERIIKTLDGTGVSLDSVPMLDEFKAIAHLGEQEISEHLKELEQEEKIKNVIKYATHKKILQDLHAKKPKSENIYVIVGDGVALSKDWHTELVHQLSLKAVPEDWDLIVLGHSDKPRCEDMINGVYEARSPSLADDKKTKYYGNFYAYAVRPKSIPVILQQMESLPVMEIENSLLSLHKEGLQDKKEDFSWSWGTHTYVLPKPVAGPPSLLTAQKIPVGHKFRLEEISPQLAKIEEELLALDRVAEEVHLAFSADVKNKEKAKKFDRQLQVIAKIKEELYTKKNAIKESVHNA